MITEKLIQELVEIKFNIIQMKMRESAIYQMMGAKPDAAALVTVAPTPKQPRAKAKKIKKPGWTYYKRKKAAERCRAYFAGLTSEQRAEISAKRVAAIRAAKAAK